MARLTRTARDPPTVRLPLMARHPAMGRQTTMARHLITVRRHGRHTQFRMRFRRYARRVIASGDVVRGAVDCGGYVIPHSLRRSTMPDPTAATLIAATVRHRVRAITTRIEVI